jgi:hypothetical protein
MFDLPVVQLEDECAARDQPLVIGVSMCAPTAQETPIPPAARFDVGDRDERLWPA